MNFMTSLKIIPNEFSVETTTSSFYYLFLFLIKMKIFIFLIIVTLFATINAEDSRCDKKEEEKCHAECDYSFSYCINLVELGEQICSCPASATSLNHFKPILGLIIAVNIYKFLPRFLRL